LYESVGYSLDELLFETLNGSSLGGFDDVLENNGNGGANSCANNAIQISAGGPELEEGENADPYYRFDETYNFPVTLNVTLDLNDEDQHDILLSGMPVLVQIASLPNLNGTDDLTIQLSSSVQINLADHGEETDGIFRAFVPVEVPHEVVYPPNFVSTSSSLLESVVFTTAARVVLLTELNNNDEDGESEDLYQVSNAQIDLNLFCHLMQFSFRIQAVISRRIMGGSVLYYQEPVILAVDGFYKISSNVTISLLVSVILFFLLSVIRYSDNKVMKLSQHTFLIALLVAAIFAMVAARAITPESDFTCRIGPIPAITFSTLVTYIVLGRLWRCSLLMSSFMTHQKDPRSESKRKRLNEINDLLSYLTQWRALIERAIPQSFKKRKSLLITPSTQLRRSVTTVELTRLLFVLMLPTIILDVVYYMMDERIGGSYSYMEFDSTGFYTRQNCFQHNDGRPIFLAIFGLFVFSLCFCVYMAYLTNELPSLFNETRLIYRSILTSFILTVVLIPFLVLTDHDTSSPNIGSFAYLFIFLALPFSMCWSLIYPKLVVVWSGEKIVISSMLQAQSPRNTSVVSKHLNRLSDTLTLKSASAIKSRGSYKISDSEPIPKWIEEKLTELQSRMQTITNTSMTGMIVEENDWITFKDLIVSFGDEMRDVDICYDHISVSESNDISVSDSNNEMRDVDICYDDISFCDKSDTENPSSTGRC